MNAKGTITPLRIAVLGAGQIGSTFASRLARAGHDVTVIARPGSTRLQQLERDGAIVDADGERSIVRIGALLDEAVPYDLIVVALKAYQAEALLPALKHSTASNVLFLFNTFDPRRLPVAIGSERCTLGMPFVQAVLDADGRLTATIGAGGQKTLLSRQIWVDAFNAAGLPARFESDMPRWLRCHVPVCVALQSISVAGGRRGSGASWNEALVVARGVRASFTIVEKLESKLYPKSKARLGALPRWAIAASLWFVSRIRSVRTLMATGEAECIALVDDVLSAASPADPPVAASNVQALNRLRRLLVTHPTTDRPAR